MLPIGQLTLDIDLLYSYVYLLIYIGSRFATAVFFFIIVQQYQRASTKLISTSQ